ncbi:YebC/PmpR family DNA-binding transcriptional regulator [bacterium]|nr:YebC/PmpR family DNA-binding transcriptional regulator [bacterium]
MGRAYQNRKESMAKTSDAKAKVYSKYGREIYVVAKAGGTDPSGNLSLRSLIDRAKKEQVPTHVIEKAIDKAKGGGGEDFAPTQYEGYGPGKCMVIVDCLTDNATRTIAEVRNCFTKTKCKIGNPGTVAHMFDYDSIFVFDGESEDEILELLMEADVDVTDVECEDGKITVFAPNTEYFNVKKTLEEAYKDIDFDVDEIQYIPQTMVDISEEDVPMLEKFLDMLNDLDDVQKVYTNANF